MYGSVLPVGVVSMVCQRASEASELSHCSCQSRFQIRTYIYVAVRQALCACSINHC